MRNDLDPERRYRRVLRLLPGYYRRICLIMIAAHV